MKPQEEGMFQGLCSWIFNPEPWTQLELDHSANSSDQTILFSVKPELETTGLKATILKELNSSIQCLMLPERKPKDVIVFKDSKSHTLLVVEQDQVWVPSSSPKSEKNIPIELWKHSQ